MEMKGSELLPKDWNANPEYYEIHYVHGGQVYLLKALIVDQQLCLSILVSLSSFFANPDTYN